MKNQTIKDIFFILTGRLRASHFQGNRTRLVDPDAGTITSRYNGFGELVSQSDARGNTYTYEYDRLGRRTKRSLAGREDSTIWVYGENGHTGLLTSIQGVEVDVQYAYDDNHRVSSITETIGDSSYTLSRGYDEFSRVNEIVYPSGKRITRSYDGDGFLESVKLEGSPVWTGGDMNATGRWRSYTYGNGITTEKIYDPYHQLDSIHAGEALDYGFSFRKTNGNLEKRVNHSVGQAETFAYDSLNRLTKDTTGKVKYEKNGNIASKAGVGTYTYNTSRPHATGGITQVDPGYAPQAHELTFTPFNKIKDIEAYNESLGHTYRQDFTYGPQRSRKLVETYREGVHIRSRVYAGGIYEQVTDHESDTTTGYHYISGGDGLAAILVSRPTEDSLYYVHKDHLGSILALTDHQGSVVERYSFDAWGRRRKPSDWSQQASGTGYITNRGFTGHEHMDLFGLINMNGRIYDPALGRFLSPDPYVQMPENAQNFNRYSYALNNPLVYTDPSGYKIQGGIDYNPGAILYMNSASRSINNAGSYYSSSFHTCGINLSAFYGNYSSVSGGVYLNYRGDVVSFNTVKNNYFFPNSTIYHPVITSGPGLNPYLTGFLINKDGSDKYQYLDNVVLRNQSNINYLNKVSKNENWIDHALYYTHNIASGWGVANKGREIVEWEYIKQARYNRALSGNYSQPLRHSLRSIKSTGRILGYAGIAVSGVDIALNGVNVSNSLDLVMGGIAFIPGVGWAISGTYFIGNLSTQLITGKSIGEHIQEQFTDANNVYKPW